MLRLLLKDKSTKQNIIWATGTYADIGYGFSDTDQISADLLLERPDVIKPRILKSEDEQQERTRKKAEVSTPIWLCNQMNNYCDTAWFGREDVFNRENPDHTWTVNENPIEFPKKKTWKKYVDSRRLEITCGEAPYLVSRYDAASGDLIEPPGRRIGMLDRKLRVVNENAEDYDMWLKWTLRAFESCYGYEYLGDSLLIARINLLMTFVEYYRERWGGDPGKKLLRTFVRRITWNIWQMDGLKDTVPVGRPWTPTRQMTIYDVLPADPDVADREPVPCRIFNWRANESLFFRSLKERVYE